MSTLALVVSVRQVTDRRNSRAFVLIAAAFAIYAFAAGVRWASSSVSPALWQRHPWLDQLVLKTVIAGMTLLALRAQDIGRREAGLVGPRRSFRWLSVGLWTIGLDLLVCIIMLRFPRAIYLGRLTLPQTLVLIGIYDPCVEELFFRGWLQTSLTRMLGNASKAVIVVSACMFGLLHGFVYFRGVAGSTTIALVASTLVLGWIAATVRQRFDSLMPAIFVHVVYNLTGIFFGFVAWPILTHLKA